MIFNTTILLDFLTLRGNLFKLFVYFKYFKTILLSTEWFFFIE